MLLSVQLLSRVRLPVTPWTAAHQASLSITKTQVYGVGDAIQPSHHLSFPFPPSFNLSQHWVFSNESDLCIRWPTYWSFSFSISPSNEYSFTGWMSLQSKGHSRVFSNTTVQKHRFFWHSAFFIVQLSHPYITTGKIIALTMWTFVDKVLSLLFFLYYLGWS